jgi:hypothetical protein
LRLFYLNTGPSPVPSCQASKNGAPFTPATNPLVFVGLGWWKLTVSPMDTDTIGPLAWSIAAPTLLSQAQDIVAPLPHGTIDPTALAAAFKDLTFGFQPNEGLGALLQRPLFQFLLSLE